MLKTIIYIYLCIIFGLQVPNKSAVLQTAKFGLSRVELFCQEQSGKEREEALEMQHSKEALSVFIDDKI